MNAALNTIIMLTTDDRKILVERLNELIPFKVKVLSSFVDFEPEFAIEYDNILFIDSVVRNPEVFGKIAMFKEVFEMNCFYISGDKLWQNAMRHFATVIDVDYTKLDYQMLTSIIYNDTALQNEFTNELKNVTVDLANTVLKSSTIDQDKMTLAREYIANIDLLGRYQEREKSLEADCSRLMEETLAAQSETNRYMKAYNDLFAKLHNVNRFLLQTNVMNTMDVYTKLDADTYKDKPFIFYLKEYEELVGLDAFLATVHDAFKLQKRATVKILRLFDSHDSKRVLTIPGYYNKIAENFEKTEIYKSDFLVRFGAYEKLLDILLTNTTKLDILIIVDQKFHSDTVLSGKFITMNLCRNAQHLQNFGLSEANTIVNNSKDMKYSLDAQPSTAASKDDKFLQMSNTALIQSILELYLSVSGKGGDTDET